MEKKLDGNYTRMLRAVLNTPWKLDYRKEKAAVWPLTSHHPSKTNEICRALLEN